jgi:hypothetical protein
MRAWSLSILAAGAIAATLIAVSWRAPGSLTPGGKGVPTAGRAGADVDLATLAREIDALKAKARAPQVLVVAKPTEQAQPSAGDQAAAADPEVRLAQAKEQQRQAASTLDKKHASEQVDQVWSEKQSRGIRDAVASKDPRTVVAAVNCASSLCKIVLNHDSEDAQRQVANNLGELEPFRAGVFYSYDESANPRRTTLYVLREGHDFRETFAGR